MFTGSKAEQLKNLVVLNFDKKINVLEIGAWFGEGSTKIFLKNLPSESNLYIVDSWKKWLIKSDIKKSKISELVNNIYLTAFHNLINVVLNSENSGRRINTSIIRGDSEIILNNFKGGCFDLIFIDGSHSYKKCLSDIDNAKILINKNFSVICGDDLDKYPTEENILIAKQFKETDSVIDGFHPGVLLAVSESFKEVNMSNGFWWIWCINNEFSLVNTNLME